MPSISRLKDKWSGICCCHSDPTCIGMGGFIITASNKHVSSGFGVARLNDYTVGYCGHVGIIATSSIRNKTERRGKALVGSQVSACNIGNLVTGDPKHTSI